jgi:deoxyribodipyrimidine photolyase-related protein
MKLSAESRAIGPDDVVLVLPWQLFAEHPLVARAGDARVVLYDDPLVMGGDAAYDPGWHPAPLAWRRAAVDHWRQLHPAAVHLRRDETGMDGVPAGSLTAALEEHLARSNGHAVHVLDPVDDWCEQRLSRVAHAAGVQLVVHDTPGFLLGQSEARELLGSARHPRMATFYRRQRLRMDILVTDDGEPVGGQWSFDADNRKKLPATVAATLGPWPWPADLDHIAFPVTAPASRAWLRTFVAERLECFGPYEDAMHPGASLIFHAAITPMLNHGLLTPREVLDAVLDAAAGRSIPIASLEGFVRQLIGWREYVRAVYQEHGRRLRTSNRWEHHGSLPNGILTASTGIAPIDDVMRRVNELGWCHHIERLMVLGNYLFLTETHPNSVYDLFMATFTDALDWVMVPNVHGMSQDAGGGLMTTKPYFSGSAYLRKMGWPRGEWCDLWDALYWRWIIRHADELRANPRWSMAVRTSERFDHERRMKYVTLAERHIEKCRA